MECIYDVIMQWHLTHQPNSIVCGPNSALELHFDEVERSRYSGTMKNQHKATKKQPSISQWTSTPNDSNGSQQCYKVLTKNTERSSDMINFEETKRSVTSRKVSATKSSNDSKSQTTKEFAIPFEIVMLPNNGLPRYTSEEETESFGCGKVKECNKKMTEGSETSRTASSSSVHSLESVPEIENEFSNHDSKKGDTSSLDCSWFNVHVDKEEEITKLKFLKEQESSGEKKKYIPPTPLITTNGLEDCVVSISSLSRQRDCKLPALAKDSDQSLRASSSPQVELHALLERFVSKQTSKQCKGIERQVVKNPDRSSMDTDLFVPSLYCHEEECTVPALLFGDESNRILSMITTPNTSRLLLNGAASCRSKKKHNQCHDQISTYVLDVSKEKKNGLGTVSIQASLPKSIYLKKKKSSDDFDDDCSSIGLFSANLNHCLKHRRQYGGSSRYSRSLPIPDFEQLEI